LIGVWFVCATNFSKSANPEANIADGFAAEALF